MGQHNWISPVAHMATHTCEGVIGVATLVREAPTYSNKSRQGSSWARRGFSDLQTSTLSACADETEKVSKARNLQHSHTHTVYPQTLDLP